MQESQDLRQNNDSEQTWDDVTGQGLRPELIKRAGQQQIYNFKKMGVHAEMPPEELPNNKQTTDWCTLVGREQAKWTQPKIQTQIYIRSHNSCTCFEVTNCFVVLRMLPGVVHTAYCACFIDKCRVQSYVGFNVVFNALHIVYVNCVGFLVCCYVRAVMNCMHQCGCIHKCNK